MAKGKKLRFYKPPFFRRSFVFLSRASRLSIVHRDMSGSYRTDSKEFLTLLCVSKMQLVLENVPFFVCFYIFFIGGCPSMISDEALYDEGGLRKAEVMVVTTWRCAGGCEG